MRLFKCRNFLFIDSLIFFPDVLRELDGEPRRRDHQAGFRMNCFNDSILALGIFEAMSLQQFISLFKITDIHPHGGHVLRQGFYSRNVHMESVGIFHPDAGDILVVNIVFLMAAFKSKLLEESYYFLRLR